MKLLFENWNKFVNENIYEYDRFPWLKELREKGASEIAENPLFERVGGGAFRIVYIPKREDNVVIKVARKPDFSFMNEIEATANREFPTLFPKTYAHADDWSWILMEKVQVIKRKEYDLFLPCRVLC